MVNVVFHTAFIGDLLLSIPLLRQIRKNHMGAKIYLICRPGLGRFFIENQLVDAVFELNKKSKESVQQCIDWVNQQEVQKVYVPHMSFRTAWISLRFKANIKVSYRSFWNFLFYKKRVRRQMELPEPIRLLSLLIDENVELDQKLEKMKVNEQFKNSKVRTSILDWQDGIPEDFSMRIEVSEDRKKKICEKFGLTAPFAVIAPGSQWPTKQWTDSGYAELAKKLLQAGWQVGLVGSSVENEVCEKIRAHIMEALPDSSRKMVSIAGQTTLTELLELCSAADWVVTNDSGPMHIAAAAGQPLTAIFGPTVLDLGYRPWTQFSRVVQIDESCRPCGVHGHKKCPLGTHACMKKITADQVLKSAPSSLKND